MTQHNAERDKELPIEALDNLRIHQRQLDADGTEVGVSRQALNEVIRAFGHLERLTPSHSGVTGEMAGQTPETPPIDGFLRFIKDTIAVMTDSGSWDAKTMQRVNENIGGLIDQYLSALELSPQGEGEAFDFAYHTPKEGVPQQTRTHDDGETSNVQRADTTQSTGKPILMWVCQHEDECTCRNAAEYEACERKDAIQHTNTREPDEFGDGVTVGVAEQEPSLERYDEFWDGWGDEYRGMRQHPAGKWVKQTEAIRRIAELRAERDRAENEVEHWHSLWQKDHARAEKAEALNAELVEALEPFAEAADDLDDKHEDGSEIWEAPCSMSITAGDLRNARALISKARAAQ